jgi:hypothetical protein
MDAGAHKSSVFSALTRPVADFERDQAAAALPAITETATLRRIAEQAATQAEATAQQTPSRPTRRAAGRGHRPDRRGRQPAHPADPAVAG